MPIVTFWSEDEKEIGQTSTAIAVSTQMAIEHNYKVLLISTYNRNELETAFWTNPKQKKGLAALFEGTNKVNIDSGIKGLYKVAKSNKLTPEIITNYTRIVFKDRLEILDGLNSEITDYEEVYKIYPEIILNASMYYDMVIVDLNRNMKNEISNTILQNSNVIVYGIKQKLISINNYAEYEVKQNKNNKIVYIGRYDKFSKYNFKNISRYLKIRKNINKVSYNTLYNDALDEGGVADLFIKLKSVKSEDRSIDFLNETRELSESIIYKIQELDLNI